MDNYIESSDSSIYIGNYIPSSISTNSTTLDDNTTTSNSDSNTNRHYVSNNEDEVVPFTVIEE